MAKLQSEQANCEDLTKPDLLFICPRLDASADCPKIGSQNYIYPKLGTSFFTTEFYAVRFSAKTTVPIPLLPLDNPLKLICICKHYSTTQFCAVGHLLKFEQINTHLHKSVIVIHSKYFQAYQMNN